MIGNGPDTRYLIGNGPDTRYLTGNGPDARYLTDNGSDTRCLTDTKLPTYLEGCGIINFSYCTGNEAYNGVVGNFAPHLTNCLLDVKLVCFYFDGFIHSPTLLSEAAEDKMGAACLQGQRPIDCRMSWSGGTLLLEPISTVRELSMTTASFIVDWLGYWLHNWFIVIRFTKMPLSGNFCVPQLQLKPEVLMICGATDVRVYSGVMLVIPGGPKLMGASNDGRLTTYDCDQTTLVGDNFERQLNQRGG